ncbi:MAG: zinc ribbon domain-containing protein [Chloroflexi bacterium]|nr:zinc ribbon domain-containing protein [Chloroflexota bacterium]
MPVYEYCCQECKTKFEEFIRSSGDEEGLTCPTCGSVDIRKGFSLFGTSGFASDTSIPSPLAASNCGPVG